MPDTATIEALNRMYVCSPAAGPAWLAVCEHGLDKSLVEDMLNKSPEQRLAEYLRALNPVFEVKDARNARLHL